MASTGHDVGGVVHRQPAAIDNMKEKSTVTMEEVAVPSPENGRDGSFVSSPANPRPQIQSASETIKENLSLDGLKKFGAILAKFARFTGPGTLISVAYVDPDNFQTALDAGAQFRFKLLCIILLGVFMAVYLQALAAKLGCATGLNLAQMNRAYLPRWLNIGLYIIAEAAFICTDIGQVIGTAIAINILVPRIPLVAGCIISVADTLFILLFYKADGTIRRLRLFEAFVSVFILGVFVSFCIELSFVSEPVGEVFRGYLPSKEIFVSKGLFQSCAILGGIMMPHSLYVGSGLVQSRMRAFDTTQQTLHLALPSTSKHAIPLYRPTLSAIRSNMSYTISELCISLLVITLFINSSILIVAASSLSVDAANADLPAIYDLFVETIGQASGTLFALALLFSGISAGIVCTMAGQLACEGAMDWRLPPFVRRLLTRSVSIVPAVIIAATTGQQGLATALSSTNVVLSVALIFLTFPLLWYTSSHRFMRVNVDDQEERLGVVDGILRFEKWSRGSSLSGEEGRPVVETVSFANNWATTIGGWLIWGIVTCFNVATLVFIGLGIATDD